MVCCILGSSWNDDWGEDRSDLPRVHEKHPEQRPRIISDNGSQFISRDFKEYIRLAGMNHVQASPFCPRSNGKIERWHWAIKDECIPVSITPIPGWYKKITVDYIWKCNNDRLNSAIGYICTSGKFWRAWYYPLTQDDNFPVPSSRSKILIWKTSFLSITEIERIRCLKVSKRSIPPFCCFSFHL